MPDIFYKDGANLRTITAVYYQDGGTLRTLTEVWIGDGGTKRQVWPPAGGGGGGPVLAATASPSNLFRVRVTPGTAISSVTTATPTGYTGTVSYLWSYVSGDAGIVVSSSTSATVSFSANVDGGTPSRTAVWKCRVTDDLGFVFTNNVSIDLEYSP
jgi:hypothetical protein